MTFNDETCPLLTESSSTLESQATLYHNTPRPTPLPKLQLAALCSVRLVDPVAFTQIFPYVNEFMLRLTQDPTKVAFHSGLVESAFAIAQLCSIYHWARLSDQFGRRPVILVSIAGLAISTIMFGLSTSMAGVILSRCLGGMFAGNVAVIHSVLGELTDSSNQSIAFPIYGLFWPLGSIIGPLVGGTLANPAVKYPQLFGHMFWQVYPYFLPCFISSLVGIISVIFAYHYLAETLPTKCRRHLEMENTQGYDSFGATAEITQGYDSYGATSEITPGYESYGATSENRAEEHDNDSSQDEKPGSFRTLLSIPIIRALSVSGFALSFIATAFDVVFVLFCYSSVNAGGLGFSPSQIGFSLALAGSLSATIQLLLMPTLLRTFNIAKMYCCFISLWPVSFLLMPLLNLTARAGLAAEQQTGRVNPQIQGLLWIGIACVLALSRVGCLAYSVSMILVKDNSSAHSLGATNGLVQFAQCLSRAFAPAFVSSAFALSVNRNILYGQMWVVVMVCICAIGCSFNKSILEADENNRKNAYTRSTSVLAT